MIVKNAMHFNGKGWVTIVTRQELVESKISIGDLLSDGQKVISIEETSKTPNEDVGILLDREIKVGDVLEKMHSDNRGFNLRVESGGEFLDPDTYYIMNRIIFTLDIKKSAQHDGRPWTEKDIRLSENELIERIMNKLRPAITNAVSSTDPYEIHGY
jgi:hypothetical protein